MTRRITRVGALAGAGLLTLSMAAGATAGASGEGGWTVDTEDCPDPEATNAPLESPIQIGVVGPLSGPAGGVFKPAIDGIVAYGDYANANELIPGFEVEITVVDDAYDPSLTPGAVQGLIDEGVDVFTGGLGTPNNLAVRDTINEECIPHLNLLTGDPVWGDEMEDYPWTTGMLTPYDTEMRGYAQHISENYADATVGVYYVNSDFGIAAIDGFKEAADEFGLNLGSEQSVEAGNNDPPQAQVSALAEDAPEVLVTVPLGLQCPAFLTALAEAKAANPDWEPVVYMTNTCAASTVIIGIAGEAGDGVLTSAAMGLIDIADPANAELEPVAEYLSEIEAAGLAEVATLAAAGWNVGDVTVAILAKAAEDPDGLSQASIIEAARNLNYHSQLLREDMNYIMNGEEDAFYAEDVQIVQWDFAAGHYVDVGEPYSYETSAEG